jgi:fused signal recognition particle receptor
LEASKLGDIDIVLCDTAGRLHTAYALMEQLAGCSTAIAKVMGGQPSETLLVLDGTTGMAVRKL